MTRSLLVIGNGMVGHHFASVMRELDHLRRWHITIVGEESRPAYDRVALSSYFRGASTADLQLPGTGQADDEHVTTILGDPVAELDLAAQVAITAAGRRISYDAAVLATGSRAFVPPIPGHELTGCFVYRTLDDLDAIREYAGRGAGAGAGVVIGGGLLGLEAGDALRSLELDTHIVEAAPRLMPVQVDEAGGQLLARHVTQLGLRTHLGRMTRGIEPGADGAVARVVFNDGSSVEAGLVVFAAGIRPRDELARAAGLELGEYGGVLVDRRCRSVSDPAIFAIGEVAAVDGQTYGLVAPGYAMADKVAAVLVGQGGAGDDLADPDLSTKLKLLGVDVASFGDAHGATPGSLSLAWTDQLTGVYKKLVVTDDAKTLLGGILVGDAEAYPMLRALTGRALTVSPEQLIAPAATADMSGALPPEAQVCSCHAVTKAAITAAITEDGCTSVPALKDCTKAGTGCGSCVPMLSQLLRDSGVELPRGLCEHFGQSRSELFEILRVTGIRRFSELVGRHGSGAGCDICKPVVASMLASLGHGHVLDADQLGLQDTNDRYLANIQRDGTYSVVPRIPGGEITPDRLIVIGEVAREFELYTKITGGQRIDLFGARLEQLPAIWRRLVDAGFESGHAYGKAVRTVKSCVGSTWCRFGVQDSVGLAIALELRYRGLRAPHKIKAAVSGCARECAEARGKDFGIIATETGWNLYVGGNGGFSPRHAQLLESDLDTETLVRYIDRFLMYYVRTADRLQRTASWVESMDGGLGQLRDVIVNDSLGVCEQLDHAMAVHVAAYTDEWRATLDDPDRLRHFVPFVNDRQASDSDVVFVTERGQRRPPDAPGAEQRQPVLIASGSIKVGV